MKKIFSLIAAFVLITGCDDGDMSYKSFDFTDIDPVPCVENNNDPETSSNIYYKINDTEGLILVLANGILENTPTGTEAPLEIVLGGANTLTYQNYTSRPSGLCQKSEIPATNETWVGQGTLSISTFEDPDTDGNLKGYIHQITMKNVSFKRQGSDETITINNNLFGNVFFEFDFDFDFTPQNADAPVVKQCQEGTLLYTFQADEILSLDVANFDTIFENVAGTKNIAVTQNNIDEVAVLFNIYGSSVNDDNACGQGSNVPSLPVQRWRLIGGTFIVITTPGTGDLFNHDIYLKNAIFRSLINSGDTFVLDDIIEVDETNGYFFGTYKTQ